MNEHMKPLPLFPSTIHATKIDDVCARVTYGQDTESGLVCHSVWASVWEAALGCCRNLNQSNGGDHTADL